MNSFFVVNA
ncbi:hypothetical protein ZEAMMB73_Zm00001d037562 [Zea mays]|uniref:Uncharacterized protein n=1 Tax=Zea mays TaxID=4577 RepID=A0A1D6LZ48_MAIZE|nr:hypothetical protein ZEAMMB73_Zm00001d037562 [Zea mays]